MVFGNGGCILQNIGPRNHHLPPTAITGTIFSAIALPGDIENHRIKLVKIRHEVDEFERIMERYFFGLIGADPLIGLIPVVGDIIGGLLILWVVNKATQVRMSFGDRVIIVGLGAADTAIGLTPVIGDVADFFFRAHAWSAERVRAHIDIQLAQIQTTRRHLIATGPVANDHPHLTGLRDALFRGGRTRQDVWIRMAFIGAMFALLLSYCSYQSSLRNDRISACRASGGWFCEWRG